MLKIVIDIQCITLQEPIFRSGINAFYSVIVERGMTCLYLSRIPKL
jgi:hypothetical protein